MSEVSARHRSLQRLVSTSPASPVVHPQLEHRSPSLQPRLSTMLRGLCGLGNPAGSRTPTSLFVVKSLGMAIALEKKLVGLSVRLSGCSDPLISLLYSMASALLTRLRLSGPLAMINDGR